MSHLDSLEAESIYIISEAAAEASHPAMLYSIGKDSSVMLRLAQKAFYPGKIPFPLVHIDTSYKFKEMIEFRDRLCRELGVRLIAHTNTQALKDGANPFRLGTSRCCALLKTKALLDAAGGKQHRCRHGWSTSRRRKIARQRARSSRVRDSLGQWDPKNQRPEFWNLYNVRLAQGRPCGSFPSRTGLNSTCGNTSIARTFRSCRFTLRKSGR